MSAFDLLTSALQYQIAHTLQIPSLRPVQELTIPVVLEGKNAVVLAPTAGGKTEAAFFPLLSAMDERDWRPVSVLYLSPIRALLNNQEDRLSRYAGIIGRRAAKWHGDVGQGPRKRFIRDPADILLTTPESLEAMLMSASVPAATFFQGLQVVVVDEVHAFANDDRGAHLAAVLERLCRFCRRDVQRLGLSATVGNPEEILTWLQGSSKREGVVVSPPRPLKDANLAIDFVGTMESAARVVAELHPGKKRLVFLDSRRGVEQLGNELTALGVDTYVAHGSLSPVARRDAEKAFAEKSDCVIVATSALELGIDVGDLDHVLQIDAPRSVASFLQRMGRTGRRPGAVPNCTFLAIKPAAVLQAAAIVSLHRRGFVEAVRPSRRAMHVLAHQLMALGIQDSGVPRGDWWAWLDGATPFTDISAEDRNALVDHMLAQEILALTDGRLWLGPKGEKTFGRANFRELYAVFSTPRSVEVRNGPQIVGEVDGFFLQGLEGSQKRRTFVLGGSAWEILHVDWKRSVCSVRPTPSARAAMWPGAPVYLSYELSQEIREILVATDVDPAWSRRGRETIEGLRAEHEFLRAGERAPITHGSEDITWWTFAGGKANLLLARMIEEELGGKCVVRNTSVKCGGTAGTSEAALREVVARWGASGRPAGGDVLRLADGVPRIGVSKFAVALPEGEVARLVGEGAFDLEGAKRCVEPNRVEGSGDRAGLRTSGRKLDDQTTVIAESNAVESPVPRIHDGRASGQGRTHADVVDWRVRELSCGDTIG